MKRRAYHYPAHTMIYEGSRGMKRNVGAPRKPYKRHRLVVSRPCDMCGIPMARCQFGTAYDPWYGVTGTTYDCCRCGYSMSTI